MQGVGQVAGEKCGEARVRGGMGERGKREPWAMGTVGAGQLGGGSSNPNPWRKGLLFLLTGKGCLSLIAAWPSAAPEGWTVCGLDFAARPVALRGGGRWPWVQWGGKERSQFRELLEELRYILTVVRATVKQHRPYARKRKIMSAPGLPGCQGEWQDQLARPCELAVGL